VLFASVLAQQLGVPLPSTPFIVAAGALAHSGDLNWAAVLLPASSAALSRVALALKRQGITNVRPLAGGLQAWIERGYPVGG